MLLSDFDFILPSELIAQTPNKERDSSRMMILHRKTGEIIHSFFREIPSSLSNQDTLVLNNTGVIPARTWGEKGSATIEFLFLREIEKKTWEVLCRPAKKVRIGDEIIFSPDLKGQVTGIGTEGKRSLLFSSVNIFEELNKIGYAPLPPYIKRNQKQLEMKDIDLMRYQTVFAQKRGSIAAPTAGLHFTKPLLQSIRENGVTLAEITLEVGLATFQPVRENIIENNKMLIESYTITDQTEKIINTAKSESRPIVAVGTTSVRALESAGKGGRIQAGSHDTDLFIYPGYPFQIVDKLLTNFHLPKSTLLMMIAAFAGLDFVKEAYTKAVENKYRFFSYGDCMLIL
ncbi:MAG: tRNA preQ1(34) S-adenosylmethionine ribosyltransferase-isomerase QueA [Candidatus Aminicenantes bacterium]|nr:tRNA preQ1(34) S-adenosylmethionine ribosyltransferase-isomerase QueA [Candidatus Aminicenantes bacterium]